MKFQTIFAYFLTVVVFTRAAEISDIDLFDLKIAPTSERYPHLGWSASFSFFISDTSNVAVGDTFSLDLEHIYRVKFGATTDTSSMIASLDDGTEALRCYVTQQAAYLYQKSIVVCQIISDVAKFGFASGHISFQFNFNSGDSVYPFELQNANYFHSGTMNIPFGSQMSTNVQFDAIPKPQSIYSTARSTTYGTTELYYLSMICDGGKLLGGVEHIEFETENGPNPINCDAFQSFISDKYNDWWFPTSGTNTNVDVVCYKNSAIITVPEGKEGDMLFFNVLQDLNSGENILQHKVDAHYSCLDTASNTTYTSSIVTTLHYAVTPGAAAVSISAVTPEVPVTLTSTTTTGWTGTYTTTYSTETTVVIGTDYSTTPEIIYHVETPSPLVTVTSTTTTGWTGTYTTTYSTETTVTVGPDGSTTPEIIYHVETPSSLVTVTSTTTTGWTGTYTTTYSTETTVTVGPDGSTTPEIIYHVETPSPLITVTSTTTTFWTGTYTTTYSTETTVTVGADSSTTPEVIYHVETPTPAPVYSTDDATERPPPAVIKTQTETTTVTSYWTETYATTYSTETTYYVGTDSSSTPNIIYHIKTPDASVPPVMVPTTPVVTQRPSTPVFVEVPDQKISTIIVPRPTAPVPAPGQPITPSPPAVPQQSAAPQPPVAQYSSDVPSPSQPIISIFQGAGVRVQSTPFNLALVILGSLFLF